MSEATTNAGSWFSERSMLAALVVLVGGGNVSDLVLRDEGVSREVFDLSMQYLRDSADEISAAARKMEDTLSQVNRDVAEIKTRLTMREEIDGSHQRQLDELKRKVGVQP